MPLGEISALHLLAHSHRVQTRYRDASGQWQQAQPEALLAVLRALGAPLHQGTAAGVGEALRARRNARWERMVEPVVVAWSGSPAGIQLRAAGGGSGWLDCSLRLENGGASSWRLRWEDLPLTRLAHIEGSRFEVRTLGLPPGLPNGYHRLRLQTAGAAAESLVIAAPPRAWFPDASEERTSWGVFLPLYALRREGGWGAGDLGALQRLVEWTAALGGSAVGTLPLTAAFLDEPFEPSPYAPASRLFWNELFLDIESIPELAGCPAAQTMVASPAFQAERSRLEREPLVDYAAAMALKRRVLEPLSVAMTAAGGARRTAFDAYRRATPNLEEYAHFRAATEQQKKPWPDWPEPQRQGRLTPGDGAAAARRYHEYVQWLVHEQLVAVASAARDRAVQLYLDLPLGVHYNSYDVWKERESFALDAAGGAPPDALFAGGQDWGFPPLDPERSRASGHRYYAAALQNYMRHAHILRIDHVMGMHRLYWVPHGFSAKEGVYVHYPANELYAIVCLESHRNQCWVIGENLGTVPSYVNDSMRERGLRAMYVGQFALTGNAAEPLAPPAAGCLASMNTHDTPSFAGFSAGRDFEDRIGLGLLDAAGAEAEKAGRRAAIDALIAYFRRQGWLSATTSSPEEIVAACLKYLGRSQAELVLVNLEDLWGETESQNVPGTWRERPNWRRKARLSLEEFSRSPQVVKALHGVRPPSG